MEKGLQLAAEIREDVGTHSAVKLRKAGRIPAVMYGHKQEPMTISLNAHDLLEGLSYGTRLVDVQIGKKHQKVLIKDLQYDYLGRNIIHVDLMRVDVAEMVKVMVPIELKGTAKGTHEGGILEERTDHLEIECKAADIPESIFISVKEIGVGDVIHAGDVELPGGVKLVSSPETILLSCSLVAMAKSTEELEEEAPVAPEVIGEVKETEEEESKEKQGEKRKVENHG